MAGALARAAAAKQEAAAKGAKMAASKVAALRREEAASLAFTKEMNEKRHAEALGRAAAAKQEVAAKGARMAGGSLAGHVGLSATARAACEAEATKALLDAKMTAALGRAADAKTAAAAKGAQMARSAPKEAVAEAARVAAAKQATEQAARHASAEARAQVARLAKQHKASLMALPSSKKRALLEVSADTSLSSPLSLSARSPSSPDDDDGDESLALFSCSPSGGDLSVAGLLNSRPSSPRVSTYASPVGSEIGSDADEIENSPTGAASIAVASLGSPTGSPLATPSLPSPPSSTYRGPNSSNLDGQLQADYSYGYAWPYVGIGPPESSAKATLAGAFAGAATTIATSASLGDSHELSSADVPIDQPAIVDLVVDDIIGNDNDLLAMLVEVPAAGGAELQERRTLSAPMPGDASCGKTKGAPLIVSDDDYDDNEKETVNHDGDIAGDVTDFVDGTTQEDGDAAASVDALVNMLTPTGPLVDHLTQFPFFLNLPPPEVLAPSLGSGSSHGHANNGVALSLSMAGYVIMPPVPHGSN
jgi:hypothetical protein